MRHSLYLKRNDNKTTTEEKDRERGQRERTEKEKQRERDKDNEFLELANQFVEPYGLNYELVSFLGIGSFSTVWLSRNKTSGQLFSLKLVEKNEKSLRVLQCEKESWSSMSHPAVLKLIETIDLDGVVIYVSECFPGAKDLFEVMKETNHSLEEHRARNLFTQIVQAVEHCHQMGYAHRDIKLENILISSDGCDAADGEDGGDGGEERVKLIDFGLAVKLGPRLTKKFSGSPHYSPPEVFLHHPYDARQADVWALGVLLYVMLVWELPFQTKSGKEEELADLVIKGKGFEKGMEDKHLSMEVRDLINRMLTVDPIRRATLEDIKLHPWFKGVVISPSKGSRTAKKEKVKKTCSSDPKKRASFIQKLRKSFIFDKVIF